ncbi:MAG TPA: GNAT family N-acetyltransferase [Acidimicrobiia bacterium]|nr:GNAT family N-acetyltransferase [Acidimicrobiia bacterium]
MSDDDSLVHDAALSPMRPSDPPAEYPRELERWVDLPGGERMFLRPIVPEDVARIGNAFEHADIDTIRRRFFTAAPPTDRAHLEYLARVDYVRRLALVAMDADGDSVGIGRYETTDDGRAEVAIVVAPAWRRLGVATVLLQALEAPAISHGIEVFHALYLPDNTSVEKLLIGLGYGDRRVVDGIIELVKPLADAGTIAE